MNWEAGLSAQVLIAAYGANGPWRDLGEKRGRESASIWVNVINESDRSEQVTWLWLESPDEEIGWIQSDGVHLGTEIQPRNRIV